MEIESKYNRNNNNIYVSDKQAYLYIEKKNIKKSHVKHPKLKIDMPSCSGLDLLI